VRLLCAVPLYVPRSRVGAWVTTHEYLKALAARGHRVDVVAALSNQPGYEVDGVHVHPRSAALDLPDIFVSHLGDDGRSAELAEKHSVPSVRMVHGYHDENRDRLDQYPTALAVFSSRALALDTAWPGNQLVAHPPVFADDYRTTPGDHVTLSNLSAEKGGELLKYLAAALFDVPFLGVKGGYGRQVLPQPSNVTVAPVVPDMRGIYARTRILLMPSVRESYGRVAVEAACSGIPTIAHPSPGLKEAMGDAATWIDRSDLDGWVEAVRYLLRDDKWGLASERASHHTRYLAPQETVERVTTEIESLVKVAA